MRLNYKLPMGCQYAPYLLDMITDNHVLIAGTTGAGKSVLENSILYSILCNCFPGNADNGNGAKLVLLDPKKVELYMYKKLPHCIYYGDTLETIEQGLVMVRGLIDSRLATMQKRGQRKSAECPVYVFIDELVDLFTSTRAKEIIRLLSDSASISRATNVFFIVLTQSPSRKIIPAQFKLLFNCRVALFCNSAIESRQIIDDDTATQLPKHGYAIVQQNIERYKIKIPMYSDSALSEMVQFWTKQHRIFNRLFR